MEVQRIHADLHLGQTLRTVLGWKVVDFEGEPAKPLSERVLPDSPWRDVAGMMRSFDYAAARGAAHAAGHDETSDQQRATARRGVGGPQQAATSSTATPAASSTAEQGTMLAAYVADKAVYECVYETRNRPAWLSIPLEAVARIGVHVTVKVPVEELEQIIRGEHGSPHAVLGPHPHDGGVTVRTLKPLARRVEVLHKGRPDRAHPRARRDLGRRAARHRGPRLPRSR